MDVLFEREQVNGGFNPFLTGFSVGSPGAPTVCVGGGRGTHCRRHIVRGLRVPVNSPITRKKSEGPGNRVPRCLQLRRKRQILSCPEKVTGELLHKG